MLIRALGPALERIFVVEVAHAVAVEMGRCELLLSTADGSYLEANVDSQQYIENRKDTISYSHPLQSPAKVRFAEVETEADEKVDRHRGEL